MVCNHVSNASAGRFNRSQTSHSTHVNRLLGLVRPRLRSSFSTLKHNKPEMTAQGTNVQNVFTMNPSLNSQSNKPTQSCWKSTIFYEEIKTDACVYRWNLLYLYLRSHTAVRSTQLNEVNLGAFWLASFALSSVI